MSLISREVLPSGRDHLEGEECHPRIRDIAVSDIDRRINAGIRWQKVKRTVMSGLSVSCNTVATLSKVKLEVMLLGNDRQPAEA